MSESIQFTPREAIPQSAPVPVNKVEIVTEDRLVDALDKQAQTIGAAFGDALIKSQGRKKVSYGDFMARRGPREQLKRKAFQNGYEVNPSGLSTATIEKLDQLASGRYLSNWVTIVNTPDKAIHIRYANKTPDDRMTNATKFSSFTDLVNQVHAEMLSNK